MAPPSWCCGACVFLVGVVPKKNPSACEIECGNGEGRGESWRVILVGVVPKKDPSRCKCGDGEGRGDIIVVDACGGYISDVVGSFSPNKMHQ
jgi:hypothetical protein